MAAATNVSLELTLLDDRALAEVRQALMQWLEPMAEPEVINDIVSASVELCTNGLRASQSQTVMKAHKRGESILVEVLDDGGGMSVGVPETPPPVLAESGRGLFLVRNLVDVLWISQRPTGGTRAAFGKRLSR